MKTYVYEAERLNCHSIKKKIYTLLTNTYL